MATDTVSNEPTFAEESLKQLIRFKALLSDPAFITALRLSAVATYKSSAAISEVGEALRQIKNTHAERLWQIAPLVIIVSKLCSAGGLLQWGGGQCVPDEGLMRTLASLYFEDKQNSAT